MEGRSTLLSTPTPTKDKPIKQICGLPDELLVEIISYLPYPDALSLKLTNSHFRNVIEPLLTIATRVEWLTSRADLGLSIPQLRKLNLRTDRDFVSNHEVQSILRDHRLHQDCEIRAYLMVTEALEEFYQTDIYNEPEPICHVYGWVYECPGLLRSSRQFERFTGAHNQLSHSYRQVESQNTLELISVRRVCQMLWRTAKFILLGIAMPFISLISTLLWLNRVGLSIMACIWIWFERIVVLALLAHYLIGLSVEELLSWTGAMSAHRVNRVYRPEFDHRLCLEGR